jgi:hypothetical protein
VVAVSRLIIYVDVNDWPGQPAGQVSCSAGLKAELADGRDVVLLDGRGWSVGVRVVGGGAASDQWSWMTQEDVEETARTVLGPDEPAAGESYEDAARAHWSALAEALHQAGVAASADALQSLPHVVVLSDRLLGRIDGPRATRAARAHGRESDGAPAARCRCQANAPLDQIGWSAVNDLLDDQRDGDERHGDA